MTDQKFPSPSGRHSGIVLPEGHRVYAVGDIHGRLDLLQNLHHLIRADLAAWPAERCSVVYLGDYVDRGPSASGVIDTLIAGPIPSATHIFLRGNHEHFMLAFAENATHGKDWLANGGRQTLESYGVRIDPRRNAARTAQAFRAALPPAHKVFFDDLQLSCRLGSLFFVHAGVDPARPLDDQLPMDLLWIRGKFLSSDTDMGMLVVHGHTSSPEPEVNLRRINVDTGAWHTGRLTAAVLECGRYRFLST